MTARALIVPRQDRIARDPYIASVVLLVSFDGADGATTTTDLKGHALTFAGNAQLDTAASKFGGSSLLLDGTGDWVTSPDSDDWYFPGEFTIEAWFRSNTTGGNTHIISQGPAAGNYNFAFRYDYSSATQKRFVFSYYPSGTATPVATIGMSFENIDQSVFNHAAVTRDAANSIKIYLDGVQKAAGTQAGGFNSTGVLTIGAGLINTQPWTGWIDEIRITKGVCRYTSAFTAPTLPFPRS